MHRSPFAESSFAKDAFAGFYRWIGIVLRNHECVFLVGRLGLRQRLLRTREIAHGRIASVQRGPRLDVVPQLTRQRSSVHVVFCGVYERGGKQGEIGSPRLAVPSSRCGMTSMQPVGQRDEVEMLSLMLLIRRFEERASQQYQAQKIGGFCHLYISQEAVVAGAVAAVRHDDYIITAYRDHAHALARGTSANACMAELFGKETGCSRGLGGSMHFFDSQHLMYCCHAIVAAHVPLGVGLAFAIKYRGGDRVTLCFFCDCALNQRAFPEAFNLAPLYKLPLVFIFRKHLFALGTSVKRSTS